MKISNVISIRVSKIIQKNRFVKDILKSIKSKSGRVLLVGGAVRDLFLDLPIKDLDFEVYGLTIEQLEELLGMYGQVSLVGKSFGVFKLHGLDVDWSLPRIDSSGRHPSVISDPWMSYQQAFARRDLTINAMGIDVESFDLIDPFHGLQDLKNKILKAPHLDFFAQDPLRLLRVMQFSGRFLMNVDEQLSQLCLNIDISQVSSERIEQEFKKLFVQGIKPSIGLQWLMKINKFEELLPGLKDHEILLKKLDEAAEQYYESDLEKLVIMWAIIGSFLQQPKNEKFEQVSSVEKKYYINFMQRINSQKSMISQVVTCVVYAPKITKNLNNTQMKWLAFWLAPDLSIRFLLRFYEIFYSQSVQSFILQAEKLGVCDQPELPLLHGKDLLDYVQGPELGKLLKKAYQLQIDYSITDKKNLTSLLL